MIQLDKQIHFAVEDFDQWLYLNATTDYGALFCIYLAGLFGTWKSRNSEAFEDNSCADWFIYNQIMTLFYVTNIPFQKMT